LKAIRDGIQDYEYAQILKNLGQTTYLNSIILPIATSWTNWSHDGNALQTARQQLGERLNQLATLHGVSEKAPHYLRSAATPR
jgi:hypothetical protein